VSKAFFHTFRQQRLSALVRNVRSRVAYMCGRGCDPFGSCPVFLGVRGLLRFREDFRLDCGGLGCQVLSCSTLFFPDVPLPLFEMREAINAKE
jgi:hypothetical protein